MPHDALAAAVRRFPLLGRPRPTCPALPTRVREVTDAVQVAAHKAEHGMADAAHALNKAALIASDCGLPHLARRLCWQHIDAYRRADRPLTILETRYLLEPVLNLTRLHIRANQTLHALQLLKAMHQAITNRCDLTVDDHSLPLANLTGEQQERRQLREWVWLQLIGEGVRAFALADRWTEAADHARAYHGIGVHLMEGRQAAIIAYCTQGELTRGRALLAQSAPTQPWEQEIGTCLLVMCTQPDDPVMAHHLTKAAARFTARTPAAGYASYRARLGLTIATLASGTRPDLATELIRQTADEAIASADGYTARDVLVFREPVDGISQRQYERLTQLVAESGLGAGTLPELTLRRLTAAADDAVGVLDSALRTDPTSGERRSP
ncbi:hypothetical protein AB0J90_18480 [Micromonospora sp. NPDC049523]|uniref:hypothetical protein n=1 Tax=Micromonospora sp. NPDC049523 TaxID=3155921 RepID=UPI00342B78E3